MNFQQFMQLFNSPDSPFKNSEMCLWLELSNGVASPESKIILAPYNSFAYIHSDFDKVYYIFLGSLANVICRYGEDVEVNINGWLEFLNSIGGMYTSTETIFNGNDYCKMTAKIN